MSGRSVIRPLQRGTTLVEALVAMLVLAFGIAAVARLHTQLRLHGDVARQRAEAVRLAQEDIESMRAFAVAGASAGARAWADIASAARTVDASDGLAVNTSYRVTRAIAPDAAGSATHATVSVAWADRSGEARSVQLDAIVAGQDPMHAAALTIAPTGRPVRGSLGRSARIPLAARNLGDGRSAYKPSASAGDVLLFDNVTGRVLGRCTGVAAAAAALAASDLGGCDARAGELLSGVIRFALGASPDPAHARDAPLDLSMAIALGGGTYPATPACVSEARKTVRIVDAAGMRDVAVPLGAMPADLGVAGWADSGDRYVAYACVVYPRIDGAWSGRADIVPSGWTIGSTASDRRVCRYAADRDASGAIDANDEHPASYVDVRTPLSDQNYLVVSGDRTCPTASAVHVAGLAGDVFVDVSTVPHQP